MKKKFKNCAGRIFFKGIKTFAVLIFLTFLSVTAFANVYNVTNTTDGFALNQLRGAILDADALGGTHTINVAAGTYTLTLGEIVFGNTAQNITIIGAGSSSTIISMTTGAGQDRIFFINPSGTTNSPVITVQGIKFENGYLTSDPYGGAAICAGGGSGESLTLTDCLFDNNVVPINSFGGGAVCMQVSGNLTVDNCTFTNNSSNDADGGAVYFTIFSGSGYSGNLVVTNSIFTGNSVDLPGAGTSNGGALAFTGQEGIVGSFNVTIRNNTFTNNTADGSGGAISASNSPNLSTSQIHFNRFFNNVSTLSATTGALNFVESSGSVNAENNWWGCNTGPTASPCNQAGGDMAGGGSLDANPWLQLRTTASPNPICSAAGGLGNITIVTTSFLNNSDGTTIPVADLSRLIGLPVTWGPTSLGTLSAQQATIQASGTATATFTSNGTAGTATVNAQVDNVPASETSPSRANITVNTSSTAPTGATGTTTICPGGNTTLTVTGGSKGTGAITEWFTGSCGGTSAGTGDAITVSPAVTTTYYVRYNGSCNTTTCATVTVTVNTLSTAPTGTTGTTTICSGSSTTLTVDGGSKGTGASTEWFTGSCGGMPAGTGDAITVSPASTTTYYVRYNGTCNTTTCATVTVTVNTLSTAPTGATGTTSICPGGSTTLTVTGGSKGTGASTEWFTGSCGGTPAGTGDAITVSLAGTTTYYVRYSGTCNATTCATVTVTVNTLSIAPAGATGTTTLCPGNNTILTVTGGSKGTGAVTEWFTGSCGGTPAGTGDAIAVSPTTTTTYYVRYNGTCNTTTCATVTVTVNTLSTAPSGATGTTTICSGSSTTLTVNGGSKGTGAITEWFTASCGGTPAGTGDAITVSPASTTTYYVRYNGTCNATACATVTVTVNQLPTINAPTVVQPTCTTLTGTITVNATGTGTLEYKLNAGAFQTSAVFSGLAPGSYSIYVRSQSAPSCVSAYAGNPVVLSAATGCCTPVNSGTVANGDQTICYGGNPSNITFSTMPSGGAAGGSFNYQWYYKNGVSGSCPSGTSTSGWTLISGATGNSYDPPSGLTTSRTYAVTVDPTGTPDCGVATWANNCRKVTVSATVVATCSNNKPNLYFGYPSEQTATVKAYASGGVAPYTVSITMNRPLYCNVTNNSGDELWVGVGGTSVNNVCPASGPGVTAPVSTGTVASSGGFYSVNVTLMQDATITATVTDALGCTSTCTSSIHAIDVRCFAGNSGNAKVKVCHNGNTLCVSQSAVSAHLNHGDYLGDCIPECPALVSGGETDGEDKLLPTGMFGVKVFNNPTRNQFSLVVAGGNNEKIFVTVYNVLGRIVKQIETNDSQIVVFGEELKTGYYMAVVRQGTNTKTIKLIKQ